MRALVVEDDPDVGPDIVRGLESAGYIADLVRNGEDAWYKGDVEDYDVAVIDLGLPRNVLQSIIVQQCQRMGFNVRTDDELHSCEAHAVVGDHGHAERFLWVPDIHHDLRLGTLQPLEDDTVHVEGQLTFVDDPDISLGT